MRNNMKRLSCAMLAFLLLLSLAPGILAQEVPSTTTDTVAAETQPDKISPAPTEEPATEPEVMEPTAEPEAAESTTEPETTESTAEPGIVEPTAEPEIVEPTAEPENTPGDEPNGLPHALDEPSADMNLTNNGGSSGSGTGGGTGGGGMPAPTGGNLIYNAPGVTLQVVLYPYGDCWNRENSYKCVIDTVQHPNGDSHGNKNTVFNGNVITQNTFIGDPSTGRIFKVPRLDISTKTFMFHGCYRSGTGVAGEFMLPYESQPTVSGPARLNGKNSQDPYWGNYADVPRMNVVEKFLQRIIFGNQFGYWDKSDVQNPGSAYAQVLRYLGCEKSLIDNYLKSYNGQLDVNKDSNTPIPTIVWAYVVAEAQAGTNPNQDSALKPWTKQMLYFNDSDSQYNCPYPANTTMNHYYNARIITVGHLAKTGSSDSAFNNWWSKAYGSETAANNARGSCGWNADNSHACAMMMGTGWGHHHGSYPSRNTNMGGNYLSAAAGSGYVNRINSDGVDANNGNHFYHRGYWTPYGTRPAPKDAPISLHKSINASSECIAQIKDNAMYTLAGAQYKIIRNGSVTETLTTDANGNATSSRKYPIGTVLQIRETQAPKGFKLDTRVYTITVKEGSNQVNVSDIPVFDPPFAITKVDKKTTAPQGNGSFYDAIFKWEYFDNTSWSGTPKRTWYFRTNAQGRSEYNASFLAPGYNSDPLYEKAPGNYQIPIGTVTITEIANPLGYLVVPYPLKCSILQNGNDAKVEWSQDAWEYILDAAEGNFHIIESIDDSLFGSLILDKIDSVSGSVPQGDSTLAAKFEVVNNSANAVQIDGFPKANPGEVCYEFTTDENGHFKSAKIFPLGNYTVREKQAPAGHTLNSSWSGSFSVIKDNAEASFTGPNGCPDTPIYGGLKIIKQDADLGASTSAHEPLDSIQFKIVNSSDHPVTVNGTSYANGETIMSLPIVWDGTQWSASTGSADLPYGTYTVTEVEVKPGMANDFYQHDATVHTVKIRDQNVLVEVNHKDPIAPGRIEIHKVDPLGHPLTGAKFCLEWLDGSTWKPVESSGSRIIKGGCTSPNLVNGCLISGEDGLISYEGLYPTLQYRLTEVEAPDGYVLLTKPAFEGNLTADLEIVLTVHNSPWFTLPATGYNAPFHMVVIGAFAVGLALIGLLSKKRSFLYKNK